MATIKKAAKGTLAPKTSSVSSRLGSYGKKMKTGGKVPTTPKEENFAALAKPKDKITAADRIAGAKKSAGMATAKKGMTIKKAQSGISQDKRTKLKIEDKAAGIEYKSKPVRKGASTTPIYIPRTSMKKGGKMGKCKYGCK